MKAGGGLRKTASKVLVILLAVTMVFTMMPLAGSQAYAESGSTLSVQTPVLVVTGKGLIGNDGVYSSSNVSREKSYTLDELKNLGEDYVVNRQKFSALKNSPFTKNYYLVDGVRVDSLLGKTEAEIDDDVYVESKDNRKVEFLQSKEYSNGNIKTVGIDKPRYFYTFTSVGVQDDSGEYSNPEGEKGDPVPAVIGWADVDTGCDGGKELPSELPAGDTKELGYLRLYVGQLGEESGGAGVRDRNQPLFNGKGTTSSVNKVCEGDAIDEVVLTVGNKTYTRSDVLMMDFAEGTYTYDTSNGSATDCVRGVPMSVLLAGYNDSDVVTFEAADGYDVAVSGYTVEQLIDNDYILAYEYGDSWDNLSGIYETAKKDTSKFGFFRLYGGDENGKPAKLVNNITITTASGIDFSKSPYKHITNGGQEGSGPYNIDSITGATLTVEGPGVKSSVPVPVSDLEGRNAGAVRADYTDIREGTETTRTYEGIDLYYILYNMANGDSGIKLNDLAKKVIIKNRNRNSIAEFTLEQVEEAHNSETPIIVAYGTSRTDGTNIRPFVFNGAAGADSALGNEDGCIKLVYDKNSITEDTNNKYTKFGNMAYIYVAEAETPGYKHDKDPYQAPEVTNYVLTITGDKIGREVNYTVKDLEKMVTYDSEGKPDNEGMGYRDEYSLANSNYWYVNEYEGIQLWKLLLQSGLDPALATDDETIVSSTATDGYAATDKFTIKQVADPDSFGFYEKNPADLNDGTYEGNENIRQGDDVSTGDKLRTGFPVLAAYGVNGYPYVEKNTQDGYLSGLENDGGPLRIISGKLKYGHANGSNQAKLLDKVVVGDNKYHYSTHKYHSDEIYKSLGENEITVKILNGAADDAPVLSEKTYKIGDIEELIYGGKLTKNQLEEAKIKTFYQLSKNGSAYSDLYEGINLNFFLQNIVELPGTKGTIMFNGDADNKLNLEDVLSVDNGSNTETGMTGLAPLLAYGKNGAPMVESSSSDGYQNKITLAEGTDYQNSITVKNDGGPVAVLFPHTNNSVSDKSFKSVTSITINLSPDKYSHNSAPYDSYADYTLTIKGEGTRLDEPKVITLGELESKQTIAFTGDYSILKDGAATASQTRYRGIDLYKLLSSTSIGLRSNADKVIVTTSDDEVLELSLSEIRNTYMNSVTGDTELPVLLAYGTGKVGAEDKEDGKPLVAEKTDEGYDDAYGNSGGPVRLVVGQTEDGDVNSGKNKKFVKSIEVTASEMTSWNHNSADIFRQYRDEKVQLLVTDKDGAELFNKTYTVGEIEDNTALVERIEAFLESTNTYEGINFWRWVKQEAGNIEGLANPVSVTIFSDDGASRPILANYHLDGLESGILDGGIYIPIILAYGMDGYPLVIGDKSHPNGEGFDATAKNNNGPLRMVIHNGKGNSLTYITKIVIVAGDGGSVEPETPADFTIKGLKSGDIELSIDDIRNLKNSEGDNIGQATGEYIRKGVTKKVKGALLKNILTTNGIENENTVITLNTPDSFESTDKGVSYNNITLKQAVDQKYFLAYQEWDADTEEWKDIDDIVKNTDIHTNLRMYRNYCDATEGADNQNDWYDQCDNITAITLDIPEVTTFKEYPTTGGIRSTWMDKDNTIWAGTYGGGLYYKQAGDSAFSMISTSGTPALESNFTSAVAADTEGGIWVSQNESYSDQSKNKGVLYIKGDEVIKYTAEDNPETIPNNYIQAIKVGSDGKVWFGSFGGLTIYDPAADSWVTYSKADAGFPATSVCTITLDTNGGAWLGFYPDGAGTEADPYKGGFCYIDALGNVSKVTTLTGEMTSDGSTSKLAQAWVRSIAIDKKDTVWAVAAGTNLEENEGGTIFKLKSGSEAPDNIYTGDEVLGDYLDGSTTAEVRVVAVDSEGALWFGTSADGVLKVDNPKINSEGKMDVVAQFAKETGSWSAANMNNVYSIDFWNGGTAYVGTSGGLMVLGPEPEPVEPGEEPAGDATADTADLKITGDALSRNGYFTIKGIKNTEGITRVDANFNWLNSSGSTGTSAVQGATLENIIEYIGLAEGAEIGSVVAYGSDGVSKTYTAEEALNADKDGNKAMFIWTEDGEKVTKVIRGQFSEDDVNKSQWAKDVVRIEVIKKTGGTDPVEEAEEKMEEAEQAMNEAEAAANAADEAQASAEAAASSGGDAAIEAAQNAETAAEDALGKAEDAVAAANEALEAAQAAGDETLIEAAEQAVEAANVEKLIATAKVSSAQTTVAKAKAAKAKAAAAAAAATPGDAAVNAAKAAEAAAKEEAEKAAQAVKDAEAAVEAAGDGAAKEKAQKVLDSAKQAKAAADQSLIEASEAVAKAENEKAAADEANKPADDQSGSDQAAEDAIKAGTTFKYSGTTYKILSPDKLTVALTKAKNVKSFKVPASVKYKGKTYKVTQINAKAFTGKKIRTVTVGKNVKTIKKQAFKGSKATKVIIKTKALKKAAIKGSLKSSKVKTVQISVGKKAENKKYVKKYKKIFTKANAGKKVTMK